MAAKKSYFVNSRTRDVRIYDSNSQTELPIQPNGTYKVDVYPDAVERYYTVRGLKNPGDPGNDKAWYSPELVAIKRIVVGTGGNGELTYEAYPRKTRLQKSKEKFLTLVRPGKCSFENGSTRDVRIVDSNDQSESCIKPTEIHKVNVYPYIPDRYCFIRGLRDPNNQVKDKVWYAPDLEHIGRILVTTSIGRGGALTYEEFSKINRTAEVEEVAYHNIQ